MTRVNVSLSWYHGAGAGAGRKPRVAASVMTAGACPLCGGGGGRNDSVTARPSAVVLRYPLTLLNVAVDMMTVDDEQPAAAEHGRPIGGPGRPVTIVALTVT